MLVGTAGQSSDAPNAPSAPQGNEAPEGYNPSEYNTQGFFDGADNGEGDDDLYDEEGNVVDPSNVPTDQPLYYSDGTPYDPNNTGESPNPIGTPSDSQRNEAQGQQPPATRPLQEPQVQKEQVRRAPAPSVPSYAIEERVKTLAKKWELEEGFLPDILGLINDAVSVSVAADRRNEVFIEEQLGVNPDYARQMGPRIQAGLQHVAPERRADPNLVMMSAFAAEVEMAGDGAKFSEVIGRIHSRLNPGQPARPSQSQRPIRQQPDAANSTMLRNASVAPSQRPLPPGTGGAGGSVRKARQNARPANVPQSGAIAWLSEIGFLPPEEREQAERESKRKYNPFG